jgi:predicted PurR-regulated permease PerM
LTLDDRLNRTLKLLAIAALSVVLIVALVAFLHRIIAVVIVVGGAVFFAYLIYPVVRRFSRRMPRWLAILCVYALVAVVLGLFVAVLGPKLGSETRSFVQDFPQIVQQAQDQALGANASIIGAIPVDEREAAIKVLDGMLATLQRNAGDITARALTIVLSLASIVTAFVIIPVLAFYILMDADRLRIGFLRLIPAAYRAMTLSLLQDIDAVLGGFIRGQIIVGACIATLITIMLLLLGIKYALLIGVFAGVVNIIPYLGAIAGAVPAVLIALFTHGVGWALLVVAGFVLVNQAEGHIIAPLVVGQRVGLTPLMVVIAILTGAELGGILGMFIAVPLAGVIKAMVTRFAQALPDETVLHPTATRATANTRDSAK